MQKYKEAMFDFDYDTEIERRYHPENFEVLPDDTEDHDES